ncbi:MAG: UDP-3-O-(3-hydroxymyristoyl)glucosamine N-acyltransferase, partial [Pseudomonadota bacterium]|nr:UDP-3-O-(3-hydroxymyristoyl)glucosamine N-acyltransferase [Pseudomonadota bacterium]
MIAATFTAAGLAERFGLRLAGDGEHAVTGVGTLASAQAGELSFLANKRYRNQLATTRASVVVLHADDADQCPTTALVAQDPYVAFARIAALFEARQASVAGIHPSAVIADDATVSATASIGPHTSIGARSRIGAGARVGPGCVIGEDCEVGDDAELVARVTLVTRVRLGQRVLV